jgi:hypothetical protein
MQTTQETLTTAQNERLHTLLHTHEAGQPVLALYIGSQQDPGIRRKYWPNEDSLFVVQGAIPSTSPSTPRPRLSSSWWQMGWEDRAMGEQRVGSPSSPWLRICLAR